MEHLALENEIVSELTPFATGVSLGAAPTMRRETVLSMLSQSAQLTESFQDLVIEAGFLSAAVMGLDLFAGAEIIDQNQLRVSLGSVDENGRNVAPAVSEVEGEDRRSAFLFTIRAGHPVILADAAKETRFQDPLLIQRQIHAGVICPIEYRDHAYGAIGLFSRNGHAFVKEDVLFLQSVALFLGPARAHQKAEKTLADHSRFLANAIDSLDAVVLLLSADGTILQINRACQAVGGFSVNELRGRKLWNAFCKPEEGGAAEAAINELRSGLKQVKRETDLIAKKGTSRRMAWTFAKLSDQAPTGPAILVTGIDVTEQYKALKKLDEVMRGKRTTAEAAPAETAANPTKEPIDYRDRRAHDRRPFQCIQLVAPCVEGRMPALDQFREVRCFDICPAGFSFLLPTRPNFDELVAAFGTANSRIYLRSKVKHISPMQYEGRNVLQIGCEYVGRVHASMLTS